MPDTVEHRLEMYRLAQSRRRAGRSVWEHKIDLAGVFHNEEMTFEERRDAIIRRLRSSSWLTRAGTDTSVLDLVDELADTADADEFDEVWDAIYDYADADRVWIATH